LSGRESEVAAAVRDVARAAIDLDRRAQRAGREREPSELADLFAELAFPSVEERRVRARLELDVVELARARERLDGLLVEIDAFRAASAIVRLGVVIDVTARGVGLVAIAPFC